MDMVNLMKMHFGPQNFQVIFLLCFVWRLVPTSTTEVISFNAYSSNPRYSRLCVSDHFQRPGNAPTSVVYILLHLPPNRTTSDPIQVTGTFGRKDDHDTSGGLVHLRTIAGEYVHVKWEVQLSPHWHIQSRLVSPTASLTEPEKSASGLPYLVLHMFAEPSDKRLYFYLNLGQLHYSASRLFNFKGCNRSVCCLAANQVADKREADNNNNRLEQFLTVQALVPSAKLPVDLYPDSVGKYCRDLIVLESQDTPADPSSPVRVWVRQASTPNQLATVRNLYIVLWQNAHWQIGRYMPGRANNLLGDLSIAIPQQNFYDGKFRPGLTTHVSNGRPPTLLTDLNPHLIRLRGELDASNSTSTAPIISIPAVVKLVMIDSNSRPNAVQWASQQAGQSPLGHVTLAADSRIDFIEIVVPEVLHPQGCGGVDPFYPARRYSVGVPRPRSIYHHETRRRLVADRLASALSTRCDANYMTVALRKDNLQGLCIRAEDLCLSKRYCGAHENETHLWFHTLLDRCWHREAYRQIDRQLGVCTNSMILKAENRSDSSANRAYIVGNRVLRCPCGPQATPFEQSELPAHLSKVHTTLHRSGFTKTSPTCGLNASLSLSNRSMAARRKSRTIIPEDENDQNDTLTDFYMGFDDGRGDSYGSGFAFVKIKLNDSFAGSLSIMAQHCWLSSYAAAEDGLSDNDKSSPDPLYRVENGNLDTDAGVNHVYDLITDGCISVRPAGEMQPPLAIESVTSSPTSAEITMKLRLTSPTSFSSSSSLSASLSSLATSAASSATTASSLSSPTSTTLPSSTLTSSTSTSISSLSEAGSSNCAMQLYCAIVPCTRRASLNYTQCLSSQQRFCAGNLAVGQTVTYPHTISVSSRPFCLSPKNSNSSSVGHDSVSVAVFTSNCRSCHPGKRPKFQHQKLEFSISEHPQLSIPIWLYSAVSCSVLAAFAVLTAAAVYLIQRRYPLQGHGRDRRSVQTTDSSTSTSTVPLVSVLSSRTASNLSASSSASCSTTSSSNSYAVSLTSSTVGFLANARPSQPKKSAVVFRSDLGLDCGSSSDMIRSQQRQPLLSVSSQSNASSV